jgi:Tfp pilus assembly protein PilF
MNIALALLLVAGSGWDAPFSRGEALERAGRYEQALIEFEAALAAAIAEDPNSVNVPVTWNNLGVVNRALGRTNDAERYYRLALVWYEKRPQFEEALATTLENLAVVELAAGRISKAEPLYRRSYEIRRGVLTPGDPAIAQSLHGLAELEYNRHRPAAAEAYYREALAIEEARLGRESIKIASTLHNLATVWAETGRTDEARAAYRRVLAIYRSASPGHPSEAVVLRHLAELDSSEEEFREALEICARMLPPDHPQTGVILQAYGMFLRKAHRGKEAEAVLARANEILGRSGRESGSVWLVDAKGYGKR